MNERNMNECFKIEILNEWNNMRVIFIKAFPTDQPTDRLTDTASY